jgi:hypothetical protein
MIYLIHCKNLCKCYNVPPPSTTEKKKKKRSGQVPVASPVIIASWEATIRKITVPSQLEQKVHATPLQPI